MRRNHGTASGAATPVRRPVVSRSNGVRIGYGFAASQPVPRPRFRLSVPGDAFDADVVG